MIRRSWRLLLAALVIVLLVVALGIWIWNRPAPPASLEHLNLDGGAPLTSVTPATSIKTRIALAVTAEEMLTDKQLLAISKDASARIIQVVLPKDDCVLQQKTFQEALAKLDGPAKVVGGIGPGATLAWRWLAEQTDDKAQAISVGFALEHVSNPPPVLEEDEKPDRKSVV